MVRRRRRQRRLRLQAGYLPVKVVGVVMIVRLRLERRERQLEVVGMVRVVGVAGQQEIRLVLVRRRVGGRILRVAQSAPVELVRVALAVDLRHEVLVVVVPQRARQFVVVHRRLVLALAPLLGHHFRVDHLELARRLTAVLPRDTVRVTRVREQVQQKLPQLDLAAACE